MPARTFIVTGISGTGVRDSLAKYEKKNLELEPRARIARVISLEKDYLKEKAKESLRQFEITGSEIMDILMLPEDLLRDLWRDSLDEAIDELAKVEDGVGVLTFHACYYHIFTKQYISITDFSRLSSLFHSEKSDNKLGGVITLVDDVFDCQQRLCSPAARRLLDPPDSIQDSLLDLFRILDWQQQEVLISKSIATHCGVRYFTFPVKHPLKTFEQLLAEVYPKVYLSHPITEIRRILRMGDEGDVNSFFEEYENHLKELQQRFVVFEPTTIDEYRFAGSKLATRWPMIKTRIPDETQILWVKPSGVSRARFVFPFGWEADERRILKKDGKSSSALVVNIKDIIDRHATARDYQLIDQSDFVYALRPIYNGNASEGVERELKYAYKLSKVRKTRNANSPSIIFCPDTDRVRFPFRCFLDDVFKNWLTGGQMKLNKKRRRLDPVLKAIQSDFRKDEQKITNFMQRKDIENFTEYIIEIIQRHGCCFSEEESKIMRADKMEIRKKEAETLVREICNLEQKPLYIDLMESPIIKTIGEVGNALSTAIKQDLG
jgi:hypothetical protein